MLILGLTSLWRARRRYYRVFYFVHVTTSLTMLFGLAMHDRQIVWYMAPSLLYYMASNLPASVEGLYKRLRHGGIRVVKVVHIPDAGGCVELTLRGAVAGGSSGFDNERQSIGKFYKLRVPSISSKSHPFTIFSYAAGPQARNDEFKILFRPYGSFTTELSQQLKRLTVSGVRTVVPPGRRPGLQFESRPASAAGARTYVAAIHPDSMLAGKVQVGDALLWINDLDVSRMGFEEVNELLQSRQEEERTLSFAPLANDGHDDLAATTLDSDDALSDNHGQSTNPAYPKILLNGIYTTCHQLDLVMQRHDDIIIVAGGAAIVTYISLLSTLRRLAATARIPALHAAVPAGSLLGLQLSSHPCATAATGDYSFGPLTYVSAIHPESVLAGRVGVGDGVLSLDGLDVSGKGSEEVSDLLKTKQEAERVLSFAPLAHRQSALPSPLENDEELQGHQGDEGDEDGHVPLYRSKRIQVHWMCRDEGLIQHVMQNYFDPASHRSEGHGREGSVSISIKLVVHHTRPPPKEPSLESSLSESTTDEDEADSSSNGSNHQLVSIPVPSHASDAAAAAPVSTYEGGKPGMRYTLLPSLTFAAIAFGGMWIIHYCSENIDQGRQGIENRLAPVLGILAWSIGVSVLSCAVTQLGDLCCAKFAYSPLNTSTSMGGIECNAVRFDEPPEDEGGDRQDGMPRYHSMGDLCDSGAAAPSPGALQVLHLQGRPDMTAVIKETVLGQKRLDAEGSLGLFVCGPNAMTAAVGQAVAKVKKENVYLYQEVFEF